MLRIQERQQLPGARNAEWVIIDANQAASQKVLRPLVTVHLRHMVHAFGKIDAGPASHVNDPLIGAGMCQPYHLLANLSGGEIPRNIPVLHDSVSTVSARLRLAREEPRSEEHTSELQS